MYPRIASFILLLCISNICFPVHAQESSSPPQDARLPLKQAAEAADARASASPQPIPAKLPLLLWKPSGEEWHAHCVKLPNTAALVVGSPPIGKVEAPTFNGMPLKLGDLLNHCEAIAFGGRLWVFKLPTGPATEGAPTRRSANLPLLRENDELVIVTQKGHRRATIEPGWLHHPELLPGEPHKGGCMIFIPREGFSDISRGDPVFHKRTGELVGAITYLIDEPVPTKPNKGELVFLDLSVPPQPLIAPLTHLWGIPVKPSPMDQEIFTRVIPMHVTQDQLGETMAPVWARNPFLCRSPHRAISTPTGVNEKLHNGFQVSTRSVGIANGKVIELGYSSSLTSFKKKETELLVQWLVEKFSEPQIFENPPSSWLLAAWGTPKGSVTLELNTSFDKTAYFHLTVRPCALAEIRRKYASSVRPKDGGTSLLLQWIASASEPKPRDPFEYRY